MRANGQVIEKPSQAISSEAVIEAAPAHPYVSRGGLKLAHGLDEFGIDPHGRQCLDIGASTGGFTDVLLRRGATHINAVDVGRAQLHADVAGDARVLEPGRNRCAKPVGRYAAGCARPARV